ncbi:DUF3106 domain-containing protein [Denitratisoma oestradiolicum]|uniref:DUF3106 domain-containing protein n=1 Tax=Denitratisoma oestradiolicum TaxID=311182 RepID=UPI001476E8A0|nr:DUF3106 domain-containing protein [Denitratisoma oestradiolicum]
MSVTYAAVPSLTPPAWKELTPQQRQILQPLAEDWDGMASFRRKKWMGIAKRYSQLTPEEQQRMQRRMKTWARLPSEERRIAREKFKKLQKVTQEKRESIKLRWEQYMELPDEEKQRLKQQALRRPLGRSLMGHSLSPMFVRPDIPKDAVSSPPPLPLPAPPKARKPKAGAKAPARNDVPLAPPSPTMP